MICSVSIDELNHDLNTSLTSEQEKEIEALEPEAFIELVYDSDYFTDLLVELSTELQQAVLDSNDCDPYDHTSKLSDIQFNASCWNNFTRRLAMVMGNNIQEKAQELWEEQQ